METHQSTAKKVVTPRTGSKQAKVIAMLRRPEGATADQVIAETGWARETVRGFMSLAKTRLGFTVAATRTQVDGKKPITTYFATV